MKPSTTVYKFEEMLKEYYSLLSEQDVQGAAPDATAAPDAAMGGAAPAGPEAGGVMPPTEFPVEEASPGLASLVQIIYKAFKAEGELNLDDKDKKFSNNTVSRAKYADTAFNIVLRNLPRDAQIAYKNQNLNGRGDVNDLNEDRKIELANLALKCLFERPKLDESGVRNVDDATKDPDNPQKGPTYTVTTKNANAVLKAIENYTFVDNKNPTHTIKPTSVGSKAVFKG